MKYNTSTIKGHENCQGKTQKVRKTHFLFSKVRSLKICPLTLLVPVKEFPYIVPHLKALISVRKFGKCGSTLCWWNAILKSSSGVIISPNFWNISRQPEKLVPNPLSLVRENHAEPLQKLCLLTFNHFWKFVKRMPNLTNSAILLLFASKNSYQDGQFFKTIPANFGGMNKEKYLPLHFAS